MKRVVWAIIFLVCVSGAYGAGTVSGQCQEKQYQTSVDARQRAFDLQVEGYKPSCMELQQDGSSPVLCHDGVCFMVHTSEDYYYVMGMGFTEGQPPLTSWWGADRLHGMRDCEKQD